MHSKTNLQNCKLLKSCLAWEFNMKFEFWDFYIYCVLKTNNYQTQY